MYTGYDGDNIPYILLYRKLVIDFKVTSSVDYSNITQSSKTCSKLEDNIYREIAFQKERIKKIDEQQDDMPSDVKTFKKRKLNFATKSQAKQFKKPETLKEDDSKQPKKEQLFNFNKKRKQVQISSTTSAFAKLVPDL